MSTISTHVLDTVLGKPASDISVRLEKLQGGWVPEGAERVEDTNWIQIATGVTDANGRCSDLKHDAAAGVYRLRFETGAYFRRAGRTSIYPELTITFTCSGEAHYHLPLLLSDNSYTTYRGS
ncbi:Hydroxyisourate hydrolase [Candidatus Sulfotelmatomonas gaucii]|uniref:5-hydroxyisourate hydrolase n=1 Tax=Candidatus Sulfuritelmatomonas gaucii TaxID=2043161 RepID=A0A2N9L788_9BACT|nr:Hydroxyisourate hydrolase [Candidatus Sulfotelmatomonas gaucii]